MFSLSAWKYTRSFLGNELRFISSGATTVPAENHALLQHVYVHHVSQTVLQHMQDKHSSWLCRHGLDRGLQLASNGTFCLSFPSRPGYDAGRIWTSYDAVKKQHWLSVYRNHKVIGQFLLLDSSNKLRPTSQHSIDMISEMQQQIASTVDHMMDHVDQHEHDQQWRK